MNTSVNGSRSRPLCFYSAVGSRLSVYHLDPQTGRLALRGGADMPAKVQYAWRHPSLPVLYVGTSSAGPRQASLENHVSAWSIAADGSLQPLGQSQILPARPVHICVHPSGPFLLSGHNFGGGNLTVHALNPDGSIGAAVAQHEVQDFGIYPHQVMTLPGGDYALIVDRGNSPKDERPEDPGALRTYRMTDGQLGAGQVVAPNEGYGFGPRHVAFHPSGRWMYVSDERFNRLHVFALDGPLIDPQPLLTLSTLRDPGNARRRQLAGPIHVHPNGRAVYVANRADGVVEQQGRQVFGGGENNIAVFEIDPTSGKVAPVQHADTESFHVRTFSMDGDARVLVAASVKPMATEAGPVAASLTVFRMDGVLLQQLHREEVATPGTELQYWTGLGTVCTEPT